MEFAEDLTPRIEFRHESRPKERPSSPIRGRRRIESFFLISGDSSSLERRVKRHQGATYGCRVRSTGVVIGNFGTAYAAPIGHAINAKKRSYEVRHLPLVQDAKHPGR
jgi:hypothetical protein